MVTRCRPLIAVSLLVAATVTCELPMESDLSVSIQQDGTWPDTLAITQSTVLSVAVRNAVTGETIAGIGVKWDSDAAGILDVAQTVPEGDMVTAADSLRAGLSATVTARSTGGAKVTVQLEGEGFVPFLAEFPITVTQLDLNPPADTVWPSTLTVTDTAMLEVQIRDAGGESVRGVKVFWQSSDPQIFGVIRNEAGERDVTPDDILNAHRLASLIGRRTGSAEIIVTVERDGFAPSERRQTVEIVPFGIQEVPTWPTRISVTDTVVLGLRILAFDGAPLQGRVITWDNLAGLPVEVLPFADGDSARVVGRTSGSVQISATVDPNGFQPAQHAKPLSVTSLMLSQPDPGWPDTLMVAESVVLDVRIADIDGNPRPGRSVRWESSDPSRLLVTTLAGPDNSGRLDVEARGTVTVRAIVGSAGFEQDTLDQPVTLLEAWVAVSAGEEHTCGITFSGDMYCWGAAPGNGRSNDQLTPSAVNGVGLSKFSKVGAGEEVSCGVTTMGVAFCWGSGNRGRLGNNDPSETDQLIPVAVAGGSRFQLVSANRATCGISQDSAAFCWGDNSFEQLGVGVPPPLDALDTCIEGVLCSLTPREVSTDLPAPGSYSAVDVGGFHACGVSETAPVGAAFCWGTNNRGQLGTGTPSDAIVPTPVAGMLTFLSISAGREHTCGITTDSSAYCWGRNNDGQLGISSFADATTPTAVASSLNFQSVGAGRLHTCGVAQGGAAYCWGSGAQGQLGNGTMGQSSTPVPVSAGHSFVSVTSGDFHTCGLTSRGALYCWGVGARGRLGDGFNLDRNVPVRVSEPN